jgi:hypothetical protein
LDCCFSGELLNFEEAKPRDGGKARDRCFIAASKEFEPVRGVEGEEQSAFTQAILRGFDLAPLSDQWVTNETLVTFLRQELQAEPQRFVSSNLGVINLVRRAGGTVEATPAIAKPLPEPTCQAAGLATQLRAWFETLGYKFEPHQVWEPTHFEWVINLPTRRGYDWVLVRGVAGEAGMGDFTALRQSVGQQKTDEGWLVTNRRISPACRHERDRAENQNLFCYTLDELLDQTADFSAYLSWLEGEITSRGIDRRYVPLGCTKEEFDPVMQQKMGISHYGEPDGWIDGYVDRLNRLGKLLLIFDGFDEMAARVSRQWKPTSNWG